MAHLATPNSIAETKKTPGLLDGIRPLPRGDDVGREDRIGVHLVANKLGNPMT